MSTTRWTLRSILKTSNAKVAAQGVTTSDATFTALLTDVIILCDATLNAVAITLPTPVGADGKIFYIKKTDVSANVVTVKTAAKTIDLLNYVRLLTYGQILIVVSNGVDWIQLSPLITLLHNGELVTLNNDEVSL